MTMVVAMGAVAAAAEAVGGEQRALRVHEGEQGVGGRVGSPSSRRFAGFVGLFLTVASSEGGRCCRGSIMADPLV